MQALKKFSQTFAAVAAAVYFLRFRRFCIFLDRQRAFRFTCQRLAKLTGLLGSYIRRSALRQMGADIACDCHIEPFTLFSSPDISIASGVYIGAHCSLGRVAIGKKTMLADGVRVPSGSRQHSQGDEEFMADGPANFKRVTIGQNCWIGANAVVMADVGDNCVIGAGAVVTRPIESSTTAVGVPARAIPHHPSNPAPPATPTP